MQSSHVPTSLALLTLLASTLAADTQSLFSALDENQDGWLQADEVDDRHRRLFDRLLRTADRDEDRRLSAGEFRAGLEPRQPAKPLVRKQGSEMPGADALLLLLVKMDANGNGLIESDEVPGQFREFFDRIEDRLGGEPDGVLDRRELTQAGPRLSQIALRVAQRMDLDVDVELALLPEKQWRAMQAMIGPRSRGELIADPQRAREFFRRLDANGDGQVTAAEVPEAIAERFEQLLERADRNRDDQLSEQELLTISRQMQAFAADRASPAQLQEGIGRLLNRLDRDGDRSISRQEAPRRLAARFDRLDTDGSGQLEPEELAPIVELLSRLRRPAPDSPGRPDAMMLPE